MQHEIQSVLDGLETTYKIRILYACESGSRAWGFASPDSDYDIRFIYARTVESYLSITEPRDVLEFPEKDLLDFSGWDVGKALQLFMGSNSPLYEWLQSPVVYREKPGSRAELQALMPEYFSLRAGCHHYSSMARKTISQDLDGDPVKLKKYFYALRPALAALWITRKGEIPHDGIQGAEGTGRQPCLAAAGGRAA